MPDTSLPEAEFWHETIHQAEDGDPVNGGVPDRATRSGGPNIAAKMLADRTRWLWRKVEDLRLLTTAAELLAAIKSVDGTGSGLDADTLDGVHASGFIAAAREGAGKGFNADMVDGRHASDFVLASREGSGNGLDADKLDGLHAWQIGAAVGDIKAILAATPPQGWLTCNGAVLAKADFPELWARSGPFLAPGDGIETFRLPDLRGEFLRGWDNGRGADPGRSLGTTQSHAVEYHNHLLPTSEGAAGALWAVNDTAWKLGANQFPGSNGVAVTYDRGEGAGGQIGGTFAGETRPRNVAVHFVIKF